MYNECSYEKQQLRAKYVLDVELVLNATWDSDGAIAVSS
jgi:hypothetical protein